MADAYRQRRFCNVHAQCLAFCRTQLLAVVQAQNPRFHGQADRANGKRARDRSATDLVYTDYDAAATELGHGLVHLVYALAFSLQLFQPLLRPQTGLPNLLTGVFSIALEELGNFSLFGARELCCNLCRWSRTCEICHGIT